MILADQVRQLASEQYIEPARRAGLTTITISAREIAQKLRWTNRFPLICSALSKHSFHEEAKVRLMSTTQPNPSSTTEFRFSVLSLPT